MAEFGEALHLVFAAMTSGPLLYAGISKLLDPQPFMTAVPSYQLPFLHGNAATTRAVGICELGLGCASLLVQAPVTAVALMLVYAGLTIIVLRAWRRGARGDCGCFGALSSDFSMWGVSRNVALLLASLVLFAVRLTETLPGYELGTAAATGVGLTFAAAAAETLAQVRRNSRA